MHKHDWKYIPNTRVMLPINGDIVHQESCDECGKKRLVKE